MENAKTEFEAHIKEKPPIKCAYVTDVYYGISDEDKRRIILPVGYSDTEYNNFLSLLNFEYDSGYGSQELGGVIWYEDGSWSDRGEYDGSEWWQYQHVPEIPKDLLQTKEE